jgi:glyoxylase-like metal-dependent hydrolase (beta-lactamase superfamily II)
MSPKIHVYTAPADKFFVNSFLIETATGVIVVDTQFLVSTAHEFGARLDELGKPLAAVIITHPHPDHYNGLPVLMRNRASVPVFANRATISGIRSTQSEKRAAWTPVYGADYPAEDGLPDHALGADDVLEIAGTQLRLIDIGPGECADNSIIHIPEADALIASDLIYNGAHPWLAEHRTSSWLRQLDEVQSRFGNITNIYAGHGQPGTGDLFDVQWRYIQDFRNLVSAKTRNSNLPTEAVEAIVEETARGREGWPLEGLIAMNARAVAEELVSGIIDLP